MSQVIIIDVRTQEEYAQGHLEGALLLDVTNGQFHTALSTLDTRARYLLYCRSGNRSGQAEHIMRQAGFDRVTNLGSVEEASQKTSRPLTH